MLITKISLILVIEVLVDIYKIEWRAKLSNEKLGNDIITALDRQAPLTLRANY